MSKTEKMNVEWKILFWIQNDQTKNKKTNEIQIKKK